jgi:hypothetical protein
MEIYICSCCGGPIIFRAAGKKQHHPFHLDSGWPCWRMQQNGQCDTVERLSFPWNTPDEERVPKLDEARRLYRRYERSKEMADLLGFLGGELRSGRADVVQDFLEFLFTEAADRPARKSLVHQIVASDGWQGLVGRLKAA